MNRREALEALAALPGLTSVKRVDLEPHDTIVIETDAQLSTELVVRIQAYAEHAFPNHKCVVLGDGLKLKVVREK